MSWSFDSEGNLALPSKKHREHLPLLNTINDVPFSMGKKLLINHLRGIQNAKTLRLRLHRFDSFGDLGGFGEKELEKLIFFCTKEDLIKLVRDGRFTVYALTEKGRQELLSPKIEVRVDELDDAKKLLHKIPDPFGPSQPLSDQERQLCNSLGSFLSILTDEQKKAVVSPAQKLLCVAGAGSGKTTVLTKRALFLNKYRGVAGDRILAITFTKKARGEMLHRLSKSIPGHQIRVETFNSFCEKLLQKYGQRIYEKKVEMASPREQFQLVGEALRNVGFTPEQIIQSYYSSRKRQGKDNRQLFFSFVHDIQSLYEQIKQSGTNIAILRQQVAHQEKHGQTAHNILNLMEEYDRLMKERGYRDYADQLLDTCTLLSKHPETRPLFDHILVDEYQDVNDIQLRLLDLLKPSSLFVVGDPRQSIYGWRGSSLTHLIEFPKKNPDTLVVQLTKNHRSGERIVSTCNKVIEETGYANLSTALSTEGNVLVKSFADEERQAQFITDQVEAYAGEKHDIFILARTHKALQKIQEYLDTKNIRYLLRTEDRKRSDVQGDKDQVTLATIHAVKGLEAKRVYVVSANNTQFPCKSNDHPVVELFGLGASYDTFAEELRVFYVALSRAKEELVICYHGSPTTFLPSALLERKKPDKGLATYSQQALLLLREWRYKKSQERGCPAYLIFTDKELISLLTEKPATLEELSAIKGFGETKIKAYGEEILDILQGLS